MKTQIRAKTLPLEQERAWKAADEHLWSQIRSLFDRCPELTGFSVQAKLSADRPNRPDEEELFVTAISISPRLSKEQYSGIFEQISGTLTDLLAERPETQSLLRGRTFARTVH